jgi:S-adenosylmethionine-diacylglycerol 3-amino-3-carboxypropyl transferase
MSKNLAAVRHDYIRYANVWEDAALLLRGLDARHGARHLSIASAGDNALMLLTTDPEIVVAVDINAPQLHLCELKCAAMRALGHADFLAFVGFQPSESRRAVFEKIAPDLSEPARAFWVQHLVLIEKGVIFSGKFERYFQLFARWVLPLIHSQKTVFQLLAPKSAAEQHDFYHSKWNTWRWRLLFKIFFSKWVMGRAGRDPAFLAQVKIPVGEFIFQKAERHLCSTAAQHNHILRFNLTGHFGDTLPDYAQPENFEKIKARLDRLHLHLGMAESAVERFGRFDCFNLSNIFEYMDEAVFRVVGAQLLAGANPGARFAYWNLMVPRNLVNLFPDRLSHDAEACQKWTTEDRGFFYNQFVVNGLDEVIGH